MRVNHEQTIVTEKMAYRYAENYWHLTDAKYHTAMVLIFIWCSLLQFLQALTLLKIHIKGNKVCLQSVSDLKRC